MYLLSWHKQQRAWWQTLMFKGKSSFFAVGFHLAKLPYALTSPVNGSHIFRAVKIRRPFWSYDVYISQFARGTNLKLASHLGEAFRQTRCPRRRLASQVNNIYCLYTYIYIHFTETERDRERRQRQNQWDCWNLRQRRGENRERRRSNNRTIPLTSKFWSFFPFSISLIDDSSGAVNFLLSLYLNSGFHTLS